MIEKPRYSPFPTAQKDAECSRKCGFTPQTCSPSYRLSYTDDDFMMRQALRPLRLQLELMKPELIQQEQNIDATVVVFGGARIHPQQTAERRLQKAQQQAENFSICRNGGGSSRDHF